MSVPPESALVHRRNRVVLAAVGTVLFLLGYLVGVAGSPGAPVPRSAARAEERRGTNAGSSQVRLVQERGEEEGNRSAGKHNEEKHGDQKLRPRDAHASFRLWCARHKVELDQIPDEWREDLLCDFTDEVLAPLLELPGDATVVALLAEYEAFYRRRNEIRSRRRTLRDRFPDATNDDRPISDTFEEEYAARRDLLAALRTHLSENEYAALFKSEFWSIQRNLIGETR